MSYISKIDLPTAPQEVCAAVDNHLAQGYQLTNEKLTLLHNVTAFHTLEESSYELDRELQRLIAQRAAHDDGIRQGIKQLEQITADDRHGELQQHRERLAFC